MLTSPYGSVLVFETIQFSYMILSYFDISHFVGDVITFSLSFICFFYFPLLLYYCFVIWETSYRLLLLIIIIIWLLCLTTFLTPRYPWRSMMMIVPHNIIMKVFVNRHRLFYLYMCETILLKYIYYSFIFQIFIFISNYNLSNLHSISVLPYNISLLLFMSYDERYCNYLKCL